MASNNTPPQSPDLIGEEVIVFSFQSPPPPLRRSRTLLGNVVMRPNDTEDDAEPSDGPRRLRFDTAMWEIPFLDGFDTQSEDMDSDSEEEAVLYFDNVDPDFYNEGYETDYEFWQGPCDVDANTPSK